MMNESHRTIRFQAFPALVLVGVFFASASTMGEIVYDNDFSMRTSRRPLPGDEWHTLTYQSGSDGHRLYNNYSGAFSWSAAFADASLYQDGWVKASTGNSAMSGFYAVDLGTAEAPNPVGMMISGDEVKADYAIYAFPDLFSNGLMRISVDIRTPDRWGTGANGTLRLLPLYAGQLNPNWGNLATSDILPVCASFGPDKRLNGSTQPFALSGTEPGIGVKGNHLLVNLAASTWYRYVMELDLEAKTYTGEVFNLGTDVPTPETVGTVVGTFGILSFYRLASAQSGPIAGFALEGLGLGSGVRGNFDNIRFAWKPTVSGDYAEFYVNDFATRRMRAVVPGTTTADYSIPAVVTDPTSCVYNYPTVRPLDFVSDERPHDRVCPLGLDGWRRHNAAGLGSAKLVNMNNETVMQLTASSSFVNLMNHLGRKITSGKMKIRADVRTPDAWHWTYRGLGIGLFTEWTYTSSRQTDCLSQDVAWASLSGSKNDEFLWGDNEPWVQPASVNGGTSAVPGKPSTWYRLVLTADVDARTSSYEVYEMGSSCPQFGAVPSSDPVISVAGVPFLHDKATAPDIGAFVIAAYGPGADASGAVLVDNVQITTAESGTDEFQVLAGWCFAGNISERFVSKNVRLFADRDRNGLSEGCDQWIARNFPGGGKFGVFGETNPCFRYLSDKLADHAYALQPLGDSIRSGKVNVRVDMRPPAVWGWQVESAMMLLVGGSRMFQGVTSDGVPFYNRAAMRVGIGSRRTSSASGLYRDNVAFCSTGDSNGAEVRTYATGTLDASHWYRLALKGDVDAHVYSLRVYDLGAAHPQADTPVGEVVAAFDDVPFGFVDSDGISSLGFAGFGAAGVQAYQEDDPTAPLFDNLRVVVPSGSILILK